MKLTVNGAEFKYTPSQVWLKFMEKVRGKNLMHEILGVSGGDDDVDVKKIDEEDGSVFLSFNCFLKMFFLIFVISAHVWASFHAM